MLSHPHTDVDTAVTGGSLVAHVFRLNPVGSFRIWRVVLAAPYYATQLTLMSAQGRPWNAFCDDRVRRSTITAQAL